MKLLVHFEFEDQRKRSVVEPSELATTIAQASHKPLRGTLRLVVPPSLHSSLPFYYRTKTVTMYIIVNKKKMRKKPKNDTLL